MISRIWPAFAIVLFTASGVWGQDAVRPKTATQVFGEARDLINAGSLEVAADLLRDFLALSPTQQDYLDLEAKYGPTTFLKLRTVPRWYDSAARDKEFKRDVLEKIVTASIAANEALLKNPNRIAKFVSNLSGPQEEYAFAVAELKRSGDAVVPQLIDTLRVDASPESRVGILRAITELGPEIVPGVLTAAIGISEEFKLPLLNALSKRPDFLALAANADTNVIPYLWYLSASPQGEPSALRDLAVIKLRELFATVYDRRQPVDEITRSARPLYDRQAKFLAGDPGRRRVRLWSWNSAEQKLTMTDVSQSQAEETIGLRYLNWALERNAEYQPAIDLALAFATDRAVERAKFGALETADPNCFRLLALAPTATLVRLLEGALAENRTALALGLIQALGAKSDPLVGSAEISPGGAPRPPALVKALDYPDPRVQLAAALALLEIPNARSGANARIVEVLKRAITVDPGSGTSKGKALVADPNSVRGDQVGNLLQAIGYQVEVLGSGRELARRIDRTADFDLVLIDRHVVDPALVDLIPMIRGDANTARRPLFIVASADDRTRVGLETLLARLAALIAATETVEIEVPEIPANRRERPADENERNRKAAVELRDRRLKQIAEQRLGRLQRLVESANIRQSEELKRRLDLRLPQVTMAAVAAEFDLSPGGAPVFMRDFSQLTDLIRRQSDLDFSVEGVDTTAMVKLVRQLEAVLTPELTQKFNAIRTKLDDEALGLAMDKAVDPATEAALRRLTAAYPGVAVIREPFSRYGFEEDVATAMPDAAQRPRDPSEKAASAKAAVIALAKLAEGSIAGFDVRPATDALRAALASDDLAPSASAALARLASPEAQSDLVRVAANANRSPSIRVDAARAAIWNLQAFGKQISKDVIGMAASATANDARLQSELAVLNSLLSGKPGDLTEALKAFKPSFQSPAAVKETTPKPDEKPGEKKDTEKKDDRQN